MCPSLTDLSRFQGNIGREKPDTSIEDVWDESIRVVFLWWFELSPKNQDNPNDNDQKWDDTSHLLKWGVIDFPALVFLNFDLRRNQRSGARSCAAFSTRRFAGDRVCQSSESMECDDSM